MIDPSFELPRAIQPNWGTYLDLKILSQQASLDHKAEGPSLQIMLAGNCNMDFFIPALTVNLSSENLDGTFFTTSYNNWIAETFVQNSKIDIWVIWLSAMGCTNGFTQQLDIDSEEVIAACERISRLGPKVIFIQPEPSIFELEPFSEASKNRTEINKRLTERLSDFVTLLSVEHLFNQVGSSNWFAPRYWEQAKIPCHPNAISQIGTEVAITISRLFKPRIKAIVVDLDDTLWGGLVGEVGPEGISTDPSGLGRPYLELQQYLKQLSKRGIALSVVSKNDPDQAKRPFFENPEMVLKFDDFVHFEASWNPKFESILKIQTSLNIGIDSICFIDDSVQERNEAAGLLPGLVVPDLPAKPGDRVEYLLKTRLFTNPKVSAEDASRSDFYKREKIPTGDNLEKYLTELNMIASAIKINTTNFDRVFSLLHKTNQFNTSLWRPSISELQNVIDEESNYSYCFKLSDRLGDAGITSVLIAERVSNELRVRGWVVSCRVFNRGFEWAIFGHLSSWAMMNGIQFISIEHLDGPRNAMVRQILDLIQTPLLPNMFHTKPVPVSAVNIPRHLIKMEM